MDFRPDGRKYSRITRKAAQIIDLLRRGSTYQLDDVMSKIKEHELKDFFIEHLDKYVSSSRVREYLRFLVTIEVLSESENLFSLKLTSKPTSNAHKAQILSDHARRFLATKLKKQLSEVIETLRKESDSILRKGELPTIERIATNYNILGNREEEHFRWAVYMLLDEEKSILSLSYSPVIIESQSITRRRFDLT